jgi:hypothetical protein
MRPQTEAELEVSARTLYRDTAAQEDLFRHDLRWFEGAICGLAVGAVVLLSSKWPELPVTASLLLAGCAGAMPYLYFEVKRLRKQVNALAHLVLHAKRSDA